MWPPTRTALIFAVGEVDPQSSGRKERQRDGQTTVPQQVMMFTATPGAKRGA